jgi:hypothetical protein
LATLPAWPATLRLIRRERWHWAAARASSLTAPARLSTSAGFRPIQLATCRDDAPRASIKVWKSLS